MRSSHNQYEVLATKRKLYPLVDLPVNLKPGAMLRKTRKPQSSLTDQTSTPSTAQISQAEPLVTTQSAERTESICKLLNHGRVATHRYSRLLQTRLQSSERRRRRVSLGVHLLDTLPRPPSAAIPDGLFPALPSLSTTRPIFAYLHRCLTDVNIPTNMAEEGEVFLCGRCGAVPMSLAKPILSDVFTPRRPRIHGASHLLKCPKCNGKARPVEQAARAAGPDPTPEPIPAPTPPKPVTIQGLNDRLASRIAQFQNQRERAMRGRPALPELVDGVRVARPGRTGRPGGPWGAKAVVTRADVLFAKKLLYAIVMAFTMADCGGRPTPAVRSVLTTVRTLVQDIPPSPELVIAVIDRHRDLLTEMGTGYGAVEVMRVLHVVRAEAGVDDAEFAAMVADAGLPTPPGLAAFAKS